MESEGDAMLVTLNGPHEPEGFALELSTDAVLEFFRPAWACPEVSVGGDDRIELLFSTEHDAHSELCLEGDCGQFLLDDRTLTLSCCAIRSSFSSMLEPILKSAARLSPLAYRAANTWQR